MAGAASDAEKEQPTATRSDLDERLDQTLDGVSIERRRNPRGLVEMLPRKARAHLPATPHSNPHNSFNVRNTSIAFLTRNALLSPCSRSIRSIGTSTNVRVSRSALTSTSAWNPWPVD